MNSYRLSKTPPVSADLRLLESLIILDGPKKSYRLCELGGLPLDGRRRVLLSLDPPTRVQAGV